MLAGGFGEHNIQGIGDKHIPLIHNVMATDFVVGVSDRATDDLLVLFNTEVGRRYLVERRGVPADVVAALVVAGLSSICNMLAAIKVARQQHLGPDDVPADRGHRRRRRCTAPSWSRSPPATSPAASTWWPRARRRGRWLAAPAWTTCWR